MLKTRTTTAAELAELIGGRVSGDGKRVIDEVAALEQAEANSVSWATNDDYVKEAARSRAGVVIVPEQAQFAPSMTAILVRDPERALVSVLEYFAAPPPGAGQGVHSTATVADSARVDGATIGAHVFIGPHATVGRGSILHAGVYIGEHSSIGEDCVLWPNVVIRERITIGHRVQIHPNTTIGSDGFGFITRGGRHVKVPQIGTIVIEDDVEIGANSAVDRAKCGVTRIGRGTKIDNLVQIAHNVEIGEDCIVAAQCGISGSSVLGHHVVLGGQAGLVDHVRVGDGAMLGAKAGVSKDLPGGAAYRGMPAQPVHEFARERAALRKLPEWAQELRQLKKRIEQLESTAHHTE